ncbi:hypothetical protein SUGI_0362580 [Cryptomeria japonica]|nr:hypothetical protein SUGI_0362580 [Cryptomeria japonica]
MEFKRRPRDTRELLSGEWRLASVKEVRDNMEQIRKEGILQSWDIARLLDGWMDGPGYRYNTGIEFRRGIGHMLLVKTTVERHPCGQFTEGMYSGVKLNSQGRKTALLFSFEDKFTEVMCFVLKNIAESFMTPVTRQAELDHLTKILEENFSHRRTILHYAADQPGNAHAQDIVKLILEMFLCGKELIKAADKYGRTALHFAALRGNVDLCNLLMVKKCGLKADEKDRNGENVLHFAVKGNKRDKVEKLLEVNEVRGLVASRDSKGKTPLHKAAANGSNKIIEFLVRGMEGVSLDQYISQADLFGQTALHEAARNGHEETVECLLVLGSKPLSERSSDGKTVLHFSAQFPDQDKAKGIAKKVLQYCQSDQEKSLLLWAWATGIGTAEKCAQFSPDVVTYLSEQRTRAAGSSPNLLVSAIKLGYDTMAWELIKRDSNTDLSTSGLTTEQQQCVNKLSWGYASVLGVDVTLSIFPYY